MTQKISAFLRQFFSTLFGTRTAVSLSANTDQKQAEESLRVSEEKYRSVVENIGIGVTMISPKMEVLAQNACMQKWFPHVDVSRRPICYESFIDPPRTCLCNNCPTYLTLQDGKVHEAIIETPAGDRALFFRVLSSPIRGKDGKLIAATEMVEDVTRQRAVEEEVHQYREHLEELIKERTKKLEETNALLLAEITERKRAETEREQYVTLFQNSSDLMVIADPNGAFIKVNPSCSQTLGYFEDELVAKPFIDFVHPDDRQCTLDEMARQLRRGFSLKFENRYVCKDGSVRWLSWRAFFDKAEGLTYATARDITGLKKTETERKAMEEALVKSEKEFRLLAEAMPQIVWVTRSDGWNIYFNRQWVDYTGLSLEESYGHGWNKPFHPDDQQRAWDAWQNAVINNAVYSLECRLRKADGTYRWWLIRAVPVLDEKGKILKWFGTCTDIDEIKHAEEKLKGRERQLNESQRLAHIGSWDWDAVNDTIWWSEEYYHVYGLDSNTPPPNYVEHLKAYTPESMKRLDAAVKRTMESGVPYELDLELEQLTESTQWIVARGEARRDEAGRIVGLRGTAQNITERKRFEEKLHSVSSYNRILIEASLDPLVTIGPGGMITDVNAATENITGYARAFLVGTDFSDYFTDHEAARAGYQQAFREGSMRDYSLEIRHRDGHVTSVLYNASVYKDETGRVIGVFAAARDITERKRAEEELKSLTLRNEMILNSAGEGIYGIDIAGNIVFMNQASLGMLGFTKQDIIGKNSHQMFHHTKADGKPNCIEDCLLHKSLARGETYRGQDDVFWTADGRMFPVEYVNTPLVVNGAVAGAVVVFRDVTERKQAEDEIRKLTEELEKRVEERTDDLQKKSDELRGSQLALMNIVDDLNTKTGELEKANLKLQDLDRLKSLFIASMSHELRTPLNSIIGFSSILHDEWVGKVNAEQKENLATILRSGKHLLSLINDVIDVSKIESGKIDVSCEDFDINDVISEAVGIFKTDVQDKALDLKVEPIHLAMHSDRRKLLQCVVNLISNAVKFTEKGTITVAARLVPAHDQGGQQRGLPLQDFVEISVSDTGIGIKEEDIPRLFGAFVRLVSPEAMTVKGTGLGLYLTKKIVIEILKGEISAESEYGKGSRFTMKIPIQCEKGAEK